jgi:cellulase (glycosyl hydrolase family 5)
MRTAIVPRTLPSLLVMASLSVACSSSDDTGSDLPEFVGALPGATPAPVGTPTPGGAPAPGGAPTLGGAPTPVGTEVQGTPPLAAPGTPGATAGGAATPGAPVDPAAPPASVPGTGGMLDVTIEAESLNQAASTGFLPEPGGLAIGSMEVGSTICYDNVDLTGVQSIDVLYARQGIGTGSGSFSARFAVLWGSGDVTTAENLGERVTVDTGGWTTFATLNVGLGRAVNEVGQLCFRGMQGNGILNIDSFTLRGTPGTNDGVTDFDAPPPDLATVPQVARPQVVGTEVQFGGPNTSVAGVSLFWSNGKYGMDRFYNAEVVGWLAQDWGAKLVRAAMAVDDARPGSETAVPDLGGYLTRKFDNTLNVKKVVNAAIENGIYVIIDWHAHAADQNGQAPTESAEAVAFFGEMASIYGGYNNVIYEIYNEPVNPQWPQIKQYAQPVINAIRAQDPDNLIVVGTPGYSSQVAAPAGDPIDDDNVAYTLHFYAGEGAHNDYRATATTAMNAGLAVMVTEWGTTPANGTGNPDTASTNTWMQFLKANNISHANWALSDQGDGYASQLQPGASVSGGWTDAQLSTSGRLVKGIIQGW